MSGFPNPAAAGFCQDCGRALTKETRRAVGQAVFCEPCLARRLGYPQASPEPTVTDPNLPPPVGFESAPTAGMPPAGTSQPGWYQKLPSPVLAALLGLIPGVGAMYNGQFAKGIAHIVIFALLNSLAHVNDVFGILVAGWVIYQAFEAYHTANAIRDGRPVPDPFGLNSIGERLGFKSSGMHTGWERTAPVPPTPNPIVTPPPASTTGAVYPSASPDADLANASVYSGPVVAPAEAQVAATDSYAHYRSESYPQPAAAPAEHVYQPVSMGEYDTAGIPAAQSRRFPLSALWLIGFGIVFLILTIGHDRVNLVDFSPWLLAGLAVFLFVRSMAVGRESRFPGQLTSRAAFVTRSLVGPGVLLTIAILLTLQMHTSISLARSWPVLLIVLGALVLVRRLTAEMPSPGATAYPPPKEQQN